MGKGTAGAHFRSNPDRLHQLLFGGAMPKRRLGMALDAIGTLSHVRDGDSDDLLHFCRQRSVREYLLTERLEGRFGFWLQFAALLRDLSR